MNDHEEIQKLLSAYAGGDLEPPECRRIEMHLAACPACRAELDNLQTLLRVLRSTPEVEPPPWMTARIMAALKQQQAEKRSWLQRIFFPLHIKLPIEVMALLVVCVIGYYLSRTVEGDLKQPATQQLRDIPAPALPIQEQYGSGKRPPPAASRPLPELSPPVVPKAAEQPLLQPAPSAPAVSPSFAPAPPAFRQESAAPAAGDGIGSSKAEMYDRSQESVSEKKKGAKGAVRNEPEVLSVAPAGRAAGAPAAVFLPQLKVRLIVVDATSASEAVRQAVSSSGGTLVATSGKQFAERQLAVRIPAVRFAELLDRLGRIGRIAERPEEADSSGMIEVVVQW